MVTFRFFLYDEVNQNAVLADNFSSSQLVKLECIDDSTGVLISKVTVCIYAPYNVSGMVPTPTMFRKSDFVINYWQNKIFLAAFRLRDFSSLLL